MLPLPSVDIDKYTNFGLNSPCNYIIFLYFNRLWGKEPTKKERYVQISIHRILRKVFYRYLPEYCTEFFVS